MRGLADQGDAMLCDLSGLFDRKRKQMASRLDSDTAENGMRLFFRGLRQIAIAQRDQAISLLWCRDPHHAGAISGQRYKYARTLRRVKLRGDISMRPGMADIESQRRLIEFTALDLDAGGLAAKRLPPVGADHKPRGQGFSLTCPYRDNIVLRVDRGRLIVEPRQAGKLGGALFQRSQQQAVLDVVAEHVETDFIAREADLGCADQAAGVVNQAHDLQFRRLVLDPRPHLQRLQTIDG